MMQLGPRLRSWNRCLTAIVVLAIACCASAAVAHEIGGSDAAFVARTRGPAPGPFLYLGAKHMFTGYDHLLFLAGVVFFLRRFSDVLTYISLFAIGHTVTLLSGAVFGFGLNSWLVDAAIGLSVVWKAFDNLRGFESFATYRPDPRFMVFIFGLIHGLGLATKLETLQLNREGLLVNLVSFNVGVEIGQVLALSLVIGVLAFIRRMHLFPRLAVGLNWAIMTAGFVLVGYQLSGYYFVGAI